MVINYAHRGASGNYPENTMLAFQKAIEQGCTGIETDVQMTHDGVLVLIHDERLSRTTTGRGYIKDFTYNEIRKFSAGMWFDKKYKNEYVPKVEELLKLAKEKNITINFELKTGIVEYPGIEEKLIKMIYSYDMQDKVILSSFNHYSMVKCKEISKDIKTGLLYMAGLYKPYEYCRAVGADAIHPSYYSINEKVIKECRLAGVKVNPYTINDEEMMKKFVSYGVDGIITNYPDRLKRILKG